MSDVIFVSAFGVVVKIDLSCVQKRNRQRIRDAWQDAAVAGTPKPSCTVAPRPDASSDEQLAYLSEDVAAATANHRRGELWFLRATAIADDHGRVIVLCHPSTNEGIALHREMTANYWCVSGGLVGIDAHGGVAVYRPPLVEFEDRAAGQKSVASLRPDVDRPAHGALRAVKFVFLESEQGAGDVPAIERFSTPDALIGLSSRSEHLFELPAPLRRISALLAETGGACRATYRRAADLDVILATIMESVSEPGSRPVPLPRAIEMSVADARDEAEDELEEALYRGPVLDAVEVEPEHILLLDHTPAGTAVRMLDRVSSAIWKLAGGRSAESIQHELSDYRATDEESAQFTDIRTSIDTLLTTGLLRREQSWTRADDVIWEIGVGGSTVMGRATESLQPLALNGSAGAIWEALWESRSASMSDLLDHCCERFGTTREVIEDDVRTLLHALEQNGVVARV